MGKSSTINRFLTSKKLQVSATPGKTKHYQTHKIGGSCTFIDGPGLVIPNLSMDKASMVLGGILPIDTLTDYGPSVELLLKKIPLAHLLKHYGIMKSAVMNAKKSERKLPEWALFLSAFGLMRGLVKTGATADRARASRIVLKDFVQGKLVFVQGPPGFDQALFNHFETNCDEDIIAEEDLDLEESFPELKLNAGVHVRGRKMINGSIGVTGGKNQPLKKRKEKIRRMVSETPYA